MFQDFEKRVENLESENKALKDKIELKSEYKSSFDSLHGNLSTMLHRTPRNLVIRFLVILPSESIISS